MSRELKDILSTCLHHTAESNSLYLLSQWKISAFTVEERLYCSRFCSCHEKNFFVSGKFRYHIIIEVLSFWFQKWSGFSSLWFRRPFDLIFETSIEANFRGSCRCRIMPTNDKLMAYWHSHDNDRVPCKKRSAHKNIALINEQMKLFLDEWNRCTFMNYYLLGL